ncbi:hypothetical protein T439DRAFT_327309 [Meredithblackwellia eburnea MCA 4105]
MKFFKRWSGATSSRKNTNTDHTNHVHSGGQVGSATARWNAKRETDDAYDGVVLEEVLEYYTEPQVEARDRRKSTRLRKKPPSSSTSSFPPHPQESQDHRPPLNTASPTLSYSSNSSGGCSTSTDASTSTAATSLSVAPAPPPPKRRATLLRSTRASIFLPPSSTPAPPLPLLEPSYRSDYPESQPFTYHQRQYSSSTPYLPLPLSSPSEESPPPLFFGGGSKLSVTLSREGRKVISNSRRRLTHDPDALNYVPLPTRRVKKSFGVGQGEEDEADEESPERRKEVHWESESILKESRWSRRASRPASRRTASENIYPTYPVFPMNLPNPSHEDFDSSLLPLPTPPFQATPPSELQKRRHSLGPGSRYQTRSFSAPTLAFFPPPSGSRNSFSTSAYPPIPAQSRSQSFAVPTPPLPLQPAIPLQDAQRNEEPRSRPPTLRHTKATVDLKHQSYLENLKLRQSTGSPVNADTPYGLIGRLTVTNPDPPTPTPTVIGV